MKLDCESEKLKRIRFLLSGLRKSTFLPQFRKKPSKVHFSSLAQKNQFRKVNFPPSAAK